MSVSLFSGIKNSATLPATVTGTTGSPTIDSSTRAGKTIYKFTGSGSITVGTAGYAEVLCVAGGGGGAGGGGAGGGGAGAGGYQYTTTQLLNAGTLTVTVGAGGTGGVGSSTTLATNGNASRLDTIVSIGGGFGSPGNSSKNLSTSFI